MKVIIHRGTQEIGGNVVEISACNTRIIVDAGIELDEGKNPIDFQAIIDSNINAVLVSHYHPDHVELLNRTKNLPAIYMGQKAYSIYQKAKEYRRDMLGFIPTGWLKNEQSFKIGDITITPYLADHSAFDAYSFLFECEGKKIFYTGDFRGNGRKSFTRYLESLPVKVDVVICEGTTLSRNERKNVTEFDLEKIIFEHIKTCDNQVFVLSSAMNIDRIVTAYKAAKQTGRIMLQDIYTSMLTEECKEYGIPNPKTFSDVYTFTFEKLPDDTHRLIRDKYKNHFISRKSIASKKYVMYIRSNRRVLEYLKNLNKEKPLQDSILLYSMWEGYKKQIAMQQFLDELSSMGIKCMSAHVSGHADSDDIRKLIGRLAPSAIMPIHTENAEWFENEYGGCCIVITNSVIEVN